MICGDSGLFYETMNDYYVKTNVVLIVMQTQTERCNPSRFSYGSCFLMILSMPRDQNTYMLCYEIYSSTSP